MNFIAEILKDDEIWVIRENRRLVSIHQNLEEVHYYCQKHFNIVPRIIDRRSEIENSLINPAH